jgi:hypothetical protein
MDNKTKNQDTSEAGVVRDDAQIVGQAEGPLRSDDTTEDYTAKDNLHTDIQQDSANGLDSVEVRGGQDGRNNRGMGSQDMDSANGVLRFNDQDDTTMQVTEAAKSSIAASDAQTNTGPESGTTINPAPAGAAVPNAQQQAANADMEADETDIDDDAHTDEGADTDEADDRTGESDEDEVARTGTDLNFQPAA